MNKHKSIFLIGLFTTLAACSPPMHSELGELSSESISQADFSSTQVIAPQSSESMASKLEIVDGQKVLHLIGSPSEIGYAHGYLLRSDIINVIENYMLELLPVAQIDHFGRAFSATVQMDESLRTELEAILVGMQAAGGAYIPGLGRSLTSQDLLLMNAITDLVTIGCSSISAWGASTAQDNALQGELAIVRNLDWSSDPDLLKSQVIFAYEPRTSGQQKLISVAFAGYVGCLSCMNEAGVSVLFNMGYGQGSANVQAAAQGFSPANLLLRQAIQSVDHDGDKRSTSADIEHVLRKHRHAGSYIVHVVEPAKQAQAEGRTPAQIFEVEAKGVAVRHAESASALGTTMLAATNHLRVRQIPKPEGRYQRIEKQAHRHDRSFVSSELWALGESVRIEQSVVHTMLLIPATRYLEIRMRAPGKSMGASPKAVAYQWEDFFD